jgi:ATP-dependent exoDNAse (exonuclease V) beta subunit
LGDAAQVDAVPESLSFPDTRELLQAWATVEQRERRTTPTRVAKTQDNDQDGPEGELDDNAPAEAETEYRSPAAKSGTAFGRAVHLVLQLVDLDNPALEGLSANAAALFGVPAERVLLFAQRALASRALQDRPAGGTVWREVYAATMRERDKEELLEGIVDLLYEMEDGSLVVVDYKTDKVSSEAEAMERMERGYRRQGEAYRELIEGATGRKVSAVNFVFLNVEPAVVSTVSIE